MNGNGALRVMIAGIGGASLGTELLKCLALAQRYEIFGCDISPTAFGLYDDRFRETYLIQVDDYVDSVINACREARAEWLVPGGEQPLVLLSASTDRLAQAGLRLLANDPQVIHRFSDKATTFEHLVGLGLQIPRTIRVTSERDLAEIGMPCVIKPATGSGGSVLVALVSTPDEAMAHAATIARCGGCPIAQEYIAANEGEFTVGVLCLPDGKIIGSVALRRSLDSKLSTAFRGRGGVISSGYSQGYIADFPAIRAQAEAISTAVGNRGAMNIQGRVRNGQFIPFEINPRFSASTYLRAMAGFNEVDLMLRHVALGETASPEPLREGWYLRSLTECFLPANRLKDHALDH